MRRRSLGLLMALGLLIASALPAGAITRGGTLDGEDHPYVGVMVAFDGAGEPMWRCSGALISPTVYVTAGHCTSGATTVGIWFDSDVQSGRPGNGYPFEAPYNGVPSSHPLYVDAAFFLYDLGVVKLDQPANVARYASLANAGAVDDLGTGRKTATITAVGYGLQAASVNPVKPEKTVAEVIRMQADLFVVNTKGVAGIGNIDVDLATNSAIVSGDAKHGGTCFGDSGGPMLIRDTDIIVGVNSFGLNGNCAGIGGIFRIDRDVELAWISSFLD